MQKGFEVVNLHGTASGVIAVPVIGENGNWWIGNEDTGVCAGGSGSSATNNVYSTEETICGTWIDGKPIYRKVISGTTAAKSGNAHIFANLKGLKIERIINISGNLIDRSNSVHVTMQTSLNRVSDILGAINMFYDNLSGNLYYHLLDNDGTLSGCTAYVILEYTKLTN